VLVVLDFGFEHVLYLFDSGSTLKVAPVGFAFGALGLEKVPCLFENVRWGGGQAVKLFRFLVLAIFRAAISSSSSKKRHIKEIRTHGFVGENGKKSHRSRCPFGIAFNTTP
jgi:hypothetical protein